MSGALVAAKPPASRAFAAGAVPGRGQDFAEDPQVVAVEDAGGGGDERGAWARVQRRVSQRVCRRVWVPLVLAMYWPRHSPMPGR